jgi:hypothetical protein
MYEVGEYSILSINTAPTTSAQSIWSVLHAAENSPAVRVVYGDKRGGGGDGAGNASVAEEAGDPADSNAQQIRIDNLCIVLLPHNRSGIRTRMRVKRSTLNPYAHILIK